MGGGSDAQIALLHQYGLNLGMAFQIIDDVLDYAGDELTIGKPAGNDLRQGLVTLPLIYALHYKHNGQAERISCLLQQSDPDADEVADVVRWVTSGPAIGEALDLARHYAARARAVLSEFSSSPERRVLEELVDFIIERSR